MNIEEMNIDEVNIDQHVVAALDLVYASSSENAVPGDIPGGNVRRGPWRNRYAMAAGIAAALVLILAYPAVTGIDTAVSHGSHRQPARRGETANARLVTSLASLSPVTIDAPRTPHTQSIVYEHRRVTDWVASVKRSGTFVYDVGGAQLTDFSAVLPKSDSGLTDPCSFTVQFGGGTQRTYLTQPAANVPMNVSGSGPMTISVTPTQPTGGVADCAMTDPEVSRGQPGTVASAAPQPVASPGLSAPPAQPTVQQAQPVISQSASQLASPPATPSGTATPTPASTSAATATPSPSGPPASTAAPADPTPEPEGGN